MASVQWHPEALELPAEERLAPFRAFVDVLPEQPAGRPRRLEPLQLGVAVPVRPCSGATAGWPAPVARRSCVAAAAANAITARPSRVMPAPAQIGEV